MGSSIVDKIFGTLDAQIMRTLIYYDIFQYPLKSAEIFRFMGLYAADESLVCERLDYLKKQQLIFQFGAFFSLRNHDDSVLRRVKGNLKAEKYLALAKKQAMLISRFPFVRGVLASGSLSKGYMDEKSDLDFFIITAPNRLWIARTLLVMYKRIFLFNSHKYFCVNYFIDEEHLEIEEKNLFTATELATVIPLYGSKQYKNLQRSNTWVKGFFPNYAERNTEGVPESKISGLKSFLEKFLNSFFGRQLEQYFLRKTLARWQKLYQRKYSEADFKVAFKSKAYAAKNHDQNFQRKILDLYEEKVRSAGLNVILGEDLNIEHHSSLLNGSLLNSNRA